MSVKDLVQSYLYETRDEYYDDKISLDAEYDLASQAAPHADSHDYFGPLYVQEDENIEQTGYVYFELTSDDYDEPSYWLEAKNVELQIDGQPITIEAANALSADASESVYEFLSSAVYDYERKFRKEYGVEPRIIWHGFKDLFPYYSKNFSS